MRFRVLTDSMPQCVWAAKPDGEIYYCNQVWSQYAGESAGITFFDAVPEGEQQEVRASFREAVRSGEPLDVSSACAADGAYRWHLGRVVPERGLRGAIVGWICHRHRHRRAEAGGRGHRCCSRASRTRAAGGGGQPHQGRVPGHRLARAAHAAQRHPRLGAACCAPARSTPRAAGRAALETHRAQRAGAGAAHRGPARRLAHHHRQAAARRRAGRPARASCDAALDAVRPGGRGQGDRARRRSSTPRRHGRCGDPDRLQQVVWNLLSNAIKFTPRGRPRRGARLARGDADVAIAGERHGHRHRAATSCRTSSTASARPTARSRARTAGSGSGSPSCATSSSCTAARSTRDERGRGHGARTSRCACRCARWPGRAAAARRRGARRGRARSRSAGADLARRLRVLVVDDERGRARAGRGGARALRRRGARRRRRRTRRCAAPASGRPDVLLSDIGVPGEDGYAISSAACAEIDRDVPAAALTAYARPRTAGAPWRPASRPTWRSRSSPPSWRCWWRRWQGARRLPREQRGTRCGSVPCRGRRPP